MIHWENCGYDIAEASPSDLHSYVTAFAYALLIAMEFPPKEERNDTVLALAGTFANSEWEEDDTIAFIEPILRAVGSTNIPLHIGTIRRTFKQKKEGQAVAGLSKLKECLPAELVERLAASLRTQQQPAQNPD